MIDMFGEHAIVALIGLFGGLLLGLAARLGRFCTLGAIEDHAYAADNTRLRMWGISIGLSMIGSFGLMAADVFDPADTFYLATAWNPLASVIGGVMFGYGMALCGNCGYGALARLGGGDLRAFVIVLVMGIATYVVMSGPLAQIRIWAFPTASAGPQSQGFAHLIATTLPLSPAMIGMIVGGVIFLMTLFTGDFWKKRIEVFWSAVVGLAIVSGWAGTTWVAQNGFAAIMVESHTFSAPVGETILYAMNGSALTLSFSIGSVAGVWTGALIGSLRKGHFRWEACEDPRELRRQITGAAIMGVGAVIAMGCSVGQGISAFSLLAYSAPITFLAIYAGARLGLRQLIEGFAPI